MLISVSSSLKVTLSHRFLDLTNKGIGDDGIMALLKALAAIGTTTNVKHLNLSGNEIALEESCDVPRALTKILLRTSPIKLLHLKLQNNCINSEGAIILAAALAENFSLKLLDLSGNAIGDEGATAIAEALLQNDWSAITRLSLEGNTIGWRGCIAFTKLLQQRPKLRNGLQLGSFDNFSNRLDIFVEDVSKKDRLDGCYPKTWQWLRLHSELKRWLDAHPEHDTPVNQGEFENIFDALYYVTDFVLSSDPWNERLANSFQVIEKMKTSSESTYLDMGSYLRGDETMDDDLAVIVSNALRSNTNWTCLNLSGGSISERGGMALSEALKCNVSVEELLLSDNAAGENALVAETLLLNAMCRKIDLSGNGIKRLGIVRLVASSFKENSTLVELNLSHNPIHDSGVIPFSISLQQNHSCKRLDLSSVSMLAHGAYWLAKALKVNVTLEELCMSGNTIGCNGARDLANALMVNKTCKILDLSCNTIGDTGAIFLAKALGSNKTLEELNLMDNLFSVEKENLLNEAGIEHPALKTLLVGVKDHLATIAFVPFLPYNPLSSRRTVLYRVERATNEKSKLEDLHEIMLAGQRNNDEAFVQAWQEKLQRRRDRDFRMLLECDWFYKDRCKLLVRAGEFQTNEMAAANCPHQSNISNMLLSGAKEVALVLRYGIAKLSLMQNFDNLDLGDEEASHLAELLRLNESVSSLYLNNNRIGPKGTKAIAEALKENRSLKKVSLSSNKIQNEGVVALAKSLHRNATLTKIWLSNNEIGNGGVSALFRAMKKKVSLHTLDLSSNLINDAGAKEIAEALLDPDLSISYLNLGGNQIGDGGVCALAACCCQANTNMQKLVLDGNPFGKVGIHAIKEASRSNRKLVTLGIPIPVSFDGQAPNDSSDDRYHYETNKSETESCTSTSDLREGVDFRETSHSRVSPYDSSALSDKSGVEEGLRAQLSSLRYLSLSSSSDEQISTFDEFDIDLSSDDSETEEDAEIFGVQKSSFYFPCCDFSSSSDEQTSSPDESGLDLHSDESETDESVVSVH